MAKTNNLEYFHSNFIKQINLITSFTEKKELSEIIKMCRLKPYECILGKYTENIILHNHWIDESRNSLHINKKKDIKIISFDLSLNRSKIISTDLYSSLSIQKISRISKLVYFLKGKDEDTLSDHYILAFLGIDGYLRTYVYIYREWQSYPSLLLGERVLTEIAANQDIRIYRESKLRSLVIYPCEEQKAWLSSWPPHESFVSDVLKQNDSIISLLNI